jgi:hypothetical protein
VTNPRSVDREGGHDALVAATSRKSTLILVSSLGAVAIFFSRDAVLFEREIKD